MGLLQRALETYDNMSALVGKTIEGKSTLAPIGYFSTEMHIEITINGNGDFVQAVIKEGEEIIIPATEDSSGRSNGLRAHPLCDQVGYICELVEEKHTLYIEQLKKWCESSYSHPMVKAVFLYVSKGTVFKNLDNEHCILRDKDGNITNLKNLIGWRVIGIGEDSGPVWENIELMNLYKSFYIHILNRDAKTELCFLTGKMDQIAKQHLCGINPHFGRARIISAGKNTNPFTYRGIFSSRDEAVTIGYLASQKSHNALKWLISNDGVYFGDRVFICWNPLKKKIPNLISPLLPQREQEEKLPNPSEYKDILKSILDAYKSQENIDKLKNTDAIIFAVFDAATTGRLAITYYSEQQASDYFNRLLQWDSTCCWLYKNQGVSSPYLFQIICMAFGNQWGNDEKAEVKVDPKLSGTYMQRLLSCRINGALFPTDIMLSLFHKAENLKIYNHKNREKLLFTVCAVIKKYRYDHWKEEWKMALEKNKKDRSYQFGRLLAVMEMIEDSTYENGERRDTNAIRLQQKYVQRPLYTTEKIMEKLKTAYYPQLDRKKPGLRFYFDSLIGEIMEKLSVYPDDELCRPLSETYLLGYYLQKYEKKTGDSDEINTSIEVNN